MTYTVVNLEVCALCSLGLSFFPWLNAGLCIHMWDRVEKPRTRVSFPFLWPDIWLPSSFIHCDSLSFGCMWSACAPEGSVLPTLYLLLTSSFWTISTVIPMLMSLKFSGQPGSLPCTPELFPASYWTSLPICPWGASNNASKSEFILWSSKISSLFLVRKVEMNGENGGLYLLHHLIIACSSPSCSFHLPLHLLLLLFHQVL